MFKRFFINLADKFKSLSPTVQGFVVVAILLVAGIIIRWQFILDEVMRGFRFFGK